MKHLGDVVCSIIERNGECLLAQRPAGKALAHKWEFPGGKVNPGEAEKDALKREIREELGIDIELHDRLTPRFHQYETFTINLIPYKCSINNGEPTPHEHSRIAWVDPKSAEVYDLADADKPILREYLSKGG